MERRKVWMPHPQEGFILGELMDFDGSGKATILPADPAYGMQDCNLNDMFYAEEYEKDVDDNCSLLHFNPATLLNNIRKRYKKNKIYTYVANILLVVNPFSDIPDLYSQETLIKYQGKSLGVLPPHVFAIADKAFRDMKLLKQSQSIIVSGESGSGKTETSKHLVRYFCELWGVNAGPIEQRIHEAIPIMEAFGNAKTTLNNNSSRFGKFIEIHFDSLCQVVGGSISHYLLEKSRICKQSEEERNYHIFYLLCAGAPEELRKRLGLTKPDDYNYLKNGCTQYFTDSCTENMLNSNQKSQLHKTNGGIRDSLLDDVNGFKSLEQAFDHLGFTEEDKLHLYSTVAAVLHLGNVTFEDNPQDVKGGCHVHPDSVRSLEKSALLLGVATDDLQKALTSRVMRLAVGKSTDTIMVPLKVHEANNARDALAKAVYSKLFDYIMDHINGAIPFSNSKYYVGILDIAGFEFFTVNGFEQFCINFANEKLQQFFNARILQEEQELYMEENLVVPKTEFYDNQDCIQLLDMKDVGIFDLLDEEGRLPGPSAQHFTFKVYQHWGNHFRLARPQDSKLKIHCKIRTEEGFMIRHYAGAVCYETSQFLQKNNDALHDSLISLIRASSHPFLQWMFQKTTTVQQGGRLSFISVSANFRSQLEKLLEKLRATGSKFIICIKPNQMRNPGNFVGSSVLTQLESSGIMYVLQLMRNGYPSRTVISELFSMYSKFLPPQMACLESSLFCKALLHTMGFNQQDYCIGKTKVFFKPDKFAAFDSVMQCNPRLVTKIYNWIVTRRWRKIQWCIVAVIKCKGNLLIRRNKIITLQKNIRMYLTRKQYLPRYKGHESLRKILVIISELQKILKCNGIPESTSHLEELLVAIRGTMINFKTLAYIDPDDVDLQVTKLLISANKEISEMKQKIMKLDKKNSSMKVEEEVQKEEEKREEKEREDKRKEDMRKRRLEIESRRKEIQRAWEKEIQEDKEFVAQVKIELEKEENAIAFYNQRMEQLKRDQALALRLSEQYNSEVDEPQSRRLSKAPVPTMSTLKRKSAVEKMTLAQLRDTINTANDVEFIKACREEVMLRMKTFHSWKEKQQKNKYSSPGMILKKQASQGSPNHLASMKDCESKSQRYFRAPLVRPSQVNSLLSTRGWWYAHFDGRYVARQMEVFPDKPARLLRSGKDDFEICPLSLEETGLTRRRGVEILEEEFEKEWKRLGGT
ncbi:unconventional myosin-VI [Anabrus simplex]|uniref:unconventional myosin-VI n=1 Tax=Anabrus simplex TaxID=316456 RepID=UPI0035A3AD26